VSYLRANIRNNHYVALVTTSNQTKAILTRIRDRIAIECSNEVGMEWPSDGIYNLVDDYYMKHIITKTRFGEYGYEPNMWFFDEFSFMSLDRVLHPITRNIITNGYYCTTPSSFTHSIDTIVSYCRDNNIDVTFHNPWTPNRLTEQGTFEPYIRNHVLNEWMDYMVSNGFDVRKLKAEIISKYIRKHKFINGKQGTT
jgi:hypothetical protein